jgi:predicted RNA-binding Zn ribbon-like protein
VGWDPVGEAGNRGQEDPPLRSISLTKVEATFRILHLSNWSSWYSQAVEPLELDPGEYGGTYKLVGGQSSLDFINTVSWPGTAREHDWFDVPTNVTLWASELGLIDPQTHRRLDEALLKSPKEAAQQLGAIRKTRGILRAMLAPMARGATPSRNSIAEFNGLVADACRDRRLDPETLQWSWPVPKKLPDIFAPVVWNAGEVATSIDPRRLSFCPSCDWLFHDTTRNASRRWCDMGDCGSRDKALRYYHRHKADHSDATSN